MVDLLSPAHILANAGGLLYAYEKSTLPGKLVLFALFAASVLSWTVMVTKFRMLRRVRERKDDFLSAFRADRQPLYTELTKTADEEGHSGDIRWNFEKFLVSPEGDVVARYAPMVAPDDAKITKAIEAALPA